ncbi:hypothetical protein OBBRIDRAFT_842278 [Obba rivulosa]|uniref:Uncharacterized protein n=1 Tax=Obba rivulosa TaxID=1052685 RepID=A0A8E2AWC6_9APHY|nr:hypothetical protein OBBRIDRAFT_842278 [Obba rivulosa]
MKKSTQLFVCEFCHREKPTLQGIRSHISQSPLCRCTIDIPAEDTPELPSGLDEADFPLPEFDPPEFNAAQFLAPEPEQNWGETSCPSKCTRIEELVDEEYGGIPKRPWVEPCSGAGAVLEEGTTAFETHRKHQKEKQEPSWAPFDSRDEWELARWLLTSGLTQKAIDDFLQLHIDETTHMSLHTTEWECEKLEAVGDELDENGNRRTETLELWKRNPVECIKELMGNPEFREHMKYAPEHLYCDPEGKQRLYENMSTGDWWWRMQENLPKGATIAPIILASDKTSLSRFSGDKSAWPQHRALEGYCLFHRCMRALLAPLIAAGRNGVDMVCADGLVRRVYPILAAYIADHPEQCLIACCHENLCPKCCVARDQRGGTMRWPMRILEAASQGASPVNFEKWGLRAVNPFWKDLPHADIFHSLTPDILHQLHKGVFKDHIVSWATACTEGRKLEVDRRFRAMPKHPELRHFKKGISLVSQWTGTEYKNMEKVFLGVLSGGAEEAVHSDDSLKQLEDAWNTFHRFKHVFVHLGIRSEFNIPKIHLMQHYVTSIRELGTADGYSTKGPERLHIEFAKTAYNFSNKKGYMSQMATWLQRQEAAHRQDDYIRWATAQDQITESQEDDDFDDGKSDSEPEDEQSPQASHKAPSQAEEEEQLANSFKIAKKPAYARAKVFELVKDFGAVDFTRYLEDRLRQLAGPSSRRRTGNIYLIIENSSVAVYTQFKVKLPHIPQVSLIPKTTMDTIYAHPAQAATAAHFSMVLACDPASNHSTDSENPPGQHSRNSLTQRRVAQVRVIFKLSEAILDHATLPLAYVEWFTPFNTHDRVNGLYTLSRSTCQHRRFASIIPITDIIRSCHLIPVWGTSMDRTWTSDTVVELCKKFYFNSYLHHHDFVEFQYLVDRDEL